MSRAALAKAIGAKGESYVSELELGRIKKGSRLHLVAKVLGVELEWLESGRGPAGQPPAYPGPPAVRADYRLSEYDSPQSTLGWQQYQRAPLTTRAAVDLLLLPPKQRAALLADYELVRHCIEQLELHCQRVIDSVKSA